MKVAFSSNTLLVFLCISLNAKPNVAALLLSQRAGRGVETPCFDIRTLPLRDFVWNLEPKQGLTLREALC